MATIKNEISSRESSPSPQRNSPSNRQTPPQTPLQVPVPSFIQVEDGGLVAGCNVPARIIFGPYKGSIKKLGPRTEDGVPQKAGPSDFKLQDSTGHEYTVDIDKTEREQPWWTCIKQTTQASHADITLFSKGSLLYLKTLKQIPQGKELHLIITPPTESAHNVEDLTSTSDVSGNTPPVRNGSSPHTKHPPIPTNGVLLEGPPFKCTFCCIEFRNPSNLDAHRVYYCPGTATKPLPSSRRRTNASTQNAASRTSIPRGLPQPQTPPKTIIVNTVNTFVCQLCQSSFESESNCESHMLLLHCDESANLCKFCNFISEKREGLCRHVFSHVKVASVETGSFLGKNKRLSQGEMSETADKDDCDEKENRFNLTAGKYTNKPRTDSAYFASSSVITQAKSSAGSHNNVSALPEHSLTIIKEEKLGVVEMSEKDGHKSINLDKVEPKLPEKGLLACAQCDFVTLKESIFMKHTALHNNLKRKMEVRSPCPDVQINAQEHTDNFPSHPDTKCHECNIVFMSKKNYIAHKQYYCAGRHADSASPVATRDWDIRNRKPSTGCTSNNVTPNKNTAKTSLNSSDRPQMPCSSKSASPHCLPCDTPEATINHSPRNTNLSRTAHVTSARSTPEERPPFDQQRLRMIHLDSDKPKFLPSSLVLQGPQLVLVTPIMISQNLGGHVNLDNKLRIPQIRPRSEQPLDLSTKPKTPPLSEIPETDGRAANASPESMSQKVRFPERQGNRCEECEISFSKKESLVIHKQYYCKGRHMLTPRGLVRSVQYSPARITSSSISHNQTKRESPEPSPRLCDTAKRSSFTNRTSLSGSVVKPRLAVHIVSHSSPSLNSNRSSNDSPTPFSTNTPCPERASTSNVSDKDYCTQDQVLLRTPDLKRHASPEENHSDKERSLPLIKRKRNLVPSDEIVSPSDSFTNGVIVKQEPQDMDQNHDVCLRRKANTTHPNTAEQNEHFTKNTRVSQSATSPNKNSATESPTQITIKQEPRETITTSNGFSEEPREFLQQSSTNGPNSPSTQPPNGPSVSASPLTIPVYRRPASRLMTVRSYLNASKPLLRGVKPMVKHCRNCNISFSSLSTFIAHKKYYCASHHQSKTENV